MNYMDEPDPQNFIVRYTDEHGEEIKVGTRVFIPEPDDLTDEEANGVVTQIDPVEGDVDDYGRPIAWGPYVHVKFDDGVEDKFSCISAGEGLSGDGSTITATFVCEEVDVVKEEK